MLDWMLMPYRRYADFSGRSQRKEYWMFTLFSFLVMMVGMILLFMGSDLGSMEEGGDPQMGPLGWLAFAIIGIWVIASIVPSIAVTIRRLHDQDKSGWFYLLSFVPYVGGIIMLVFMCIDGTQGANRFGPDPKNPAGGADIFS